MIFVLVFNLVPFEYGSLQLITKLGESIREAMAEVIPAVDRGEETVVCSFSGYFSPKIQRIPVLIRIEGIPNNLEIKGDLKKKVKDAFQAAFREVFPTLIRDADVLIYKLER
ncbi:MAG: hypothetical protein FJZ05_01165 [Candidatus Nealsonbacteria bacterium]|nr:hypothetical protein [Candidatus Nealsonbacteria bacterium]